MSVAKTMKQKLRNELSPQILDLVDESYRHAGHAGANPEGESHFDLLVVSDRFDGLNRVQRQRLVFGVLEEEMKGRVHALTLTTLTQKEYEER